jgi:hypothetical protein
MVLKIDEARKECNYLPPIEIPAYIGEKCIKASFSPDMRPPYLAKIPKNYLPSHI